MEQAGISPNHSHSKTDPASTPAGNDEWISVDSSLCFRVQGAGPLLIYICGLDGTGELFFRQAPGLADSYRVVTFPLRAEGEFTYDDLTGDIKRIMDRLGDPQAVILGESFGGTVALHFALRYPNRVKRLVVINSFPRFRGRARIRLAARLASAIPSFLIPLVRRVGNSIGLFLDGVAWNDRKKTHRALRASLLSGYRRRLQLIAEVNLEERLPAITAPALFIAGTRDRVVPSVDEARRMAALMPNAAVHIVPGAGHACLLGGKVRLADIL